MSSYKQAKELQPDLLKNIEDIVRNNTYGDPEQVLFWTSLSLRDISEELGRRGFEAGKDAVSRSLDELGYSKQTNQKHMQVGKRTLAGMRSFSSSMTKQQNSSGTVNRSSQLTPKRRS